MKGINMKRQAQYDRGPSRSGRWIGNHDCICELVYDNSLNYDDYGRLWMAFASRMIQIRLARTLRPGALQPVAAAAHMACNMTEAGEGLGQQDLGDAHLIEGRREAA